MNDHNETYEFADAQLTQSLTEMVQEIQNEMATNTESSPTNEAGVQSVEPEIELSPEIDSVFQSVFGSESDTTEESPTDSEDSSETEQTEKAGKNKVKATEDEDQESDGDDEDIETEDEEDEEDDWLTRLLRGDDEDTDDQEENEKSSKTISKNTQTKKTQKKSETNLEDIQKELEQIKQFVPLFQLFQQAMQLQFTIQDFVRRGVEVQENLAKYGIQITDEELADVVHQAIKKLPENPKSLEIELKTLAAKKKAQSLNARKRIPTYPQNPMSTRNTNPENRPLSFKEVLQEVMEEMNLSR